MLFFAASWMPTTFSTAFDAMATITRPANAGDRSSASIAGVSATTNQSETNAAPTPATASIPIARPSGQLRAWPSASCCSGAGVSPRARAAGSDSAKTSSRTTATTRLSASS